MKVAAQVFTRNLAQLKLAFVSDELMPYLNKPPLVHWLIGLCFAAGGVSELTARLVPAMLTAASVPCGVRHWQELFPRRSIAFFAFVYSDAVARTFGRCWMGRFCVFFCQYVVFVGDRAATCAMGAGFGF